MRRLVLTLAILAAARPAAACDMCAIYSALEAKDSQPGVYLAFSEQYTNYATLQEDGEEVANHADQYLRSSISQLVVGYQLDRWGFQANIPYVHRSFQRPTEDGNESGTEAGLGDVSLVAHARLLEHFDSDMILVWSALAGVELPTGDSDRLGEELAEGEESLAGAKHEGHVHSGVHGHDLALGNGATDVIVGSSLVLTKQRFSLGANVQYAIRNEGDFDYRLANELSWAVTPGFFAWLSHQSSLNVGLAITGESKGNDEIAGVAADDTARTSVFVGPVLTYSRGARFSSEVSVDLPVSQSNTALQIVPDWRLRVGMTTRF